MNMPIRSGEQPEAEPEGLTPPIPPDDGTIFSAKILTTPPLQNLASNMEPLDRNGSINIGYGMEIDIEFYRGMHKHLRRLAFPEVAERRKAVKRLESQKARTRRRTFTDEYKATHPCVDCGYTDIRALDFDHVNGEKSFCISSRPAASLGILETEIAKCQVRCANCHRIRHWKPIVSI